MPAAMPSSTEKRKAPRTAHAGRQTGSGTAERQPAAGKDTAGGLEHVLLAIHLEAGLVVVAAHQAGPDLVHRGRQLLRIARPSGKHSDEVFAQAALLRGGERQQRDRVL